MYLDLYLFKFNAVGFVPKSDICGKFQGSSCQLRQSFDTVVCGITKQIFHLVLLSCGPKGVLRREEVHSVKGTR
jgi:hypothetical protein